MAFFKSGIQGTTQMPSTYASNMSKNSNTADKISFF